jgi:hypothetical protein
MVITGGSLAILEDGHQPIHRDSYMGHDWKMNGRFLEINGRLMEYE